MGAKPNTINVLQFDERLISLLRIRRSPKDFEVIDYTTQTGQWTHDGQDLEEALGRFVTEHRLAQGRVCTVLPRHSMAARVFSLPSQAPEEIAGIIRLNAEEYVPYPVHDLVIDQCLLDKMPDGYAHVLAVYAHRDIVESHVNLLQKVGLRPDEIYVSSACLASAAVAALGETAGERYGLVNVGPTGLEILVINSGRIEFARGVAAVQDLSGSEAGQAAGIRELVSEVSASLSAYRRESDDGSGVTKVFLSSEWADIDGVCAALNEHTEFQCLPAAFTSSLVTRGAERLTGLPLVALGAALTAQGRAGTTIRLEPESLQRAHARASFKRKVSAIVTFLAAVLVGLGVYYFQAAGKRDAYIRELNQRIAEIRIQADSVIEMQRQLTILRQQVDRSGTALELLARVCDATPAAGLNITGFSFDRREGRITITGRANTTYEFNRFTEALREAGRTDTPLLAQARGGGWRMVQEHGQDVIHYEIVIPFPQGEATSQEDSFSG